MSTPPATRKRPKRIPTPPPSEITSASHQRRQSANNQRQPSLAGVRGLGPRASTEGAPAGSRAEPGEQAGSSRAPYPENLVEFFQGERVIAGGYGAEDFRVEFDLVKCHAVVDSQIETLYHRAHLRC